MSIALTALHHIHIKGQFWDSHWFIHCDQFPTSNTHFLSGLSEAIGAGVEKPKDLTSLQPFLSSRAMILILDNACYSGSEQHPNAENLRSSVLVISSSCNQ